MLCDSIIKCLEKGGFKVTTDKDSVSLKCSTYLDWELKFSSRNDYDFVEEFEEYADHYSPQEEYKAYKYYHSESIDDDELPLIKEDFLIRGRMMRVLCCMLETEMSQIFALKDNRRVNSPLSDEVIKVLNDNDIKIVSIYDLTTQCDNVKGVFTNVVLQAFASKQTTDGYLITVKFSNNPKFCHLDRMQRSFAFNYMFRKEACCGTARYSRWDLVEAFREDKVKALKMLALLESQNAQLQVIADRIDAVYSK